MIWNEVRNIYPKQFVKLEILKSHIEDDEEIVDDIAIIGTVNDDSATRELLNSKDNILIYHTSKEKISLKIRTRIGLRRIYKNAH